MRGEGWRFWGLRVGAGVLSILTGCASVTHGTQQTVKIETLTEAGKPVEGAKCTLTNERNDLVMRSGESVSVRRSGALLSIECTQPGQAPAAGQAISRVNTGMVGNILIGGMLGAAIDAGTGAGFNYPSWMQLVFGEVRNFDRSAQTGDTALAGIHLGETRTAAAPAAAPSTAAATAGTAAPTGAAADASALPGAGASTASVAPAASSPTVASVSASPSASATSATSAAAEPPAAMPVKVAAPSPATMTAAPVPAPAVPAPNARAASAGSRVSMDDLGALLPAKP